MNLRFMFFLFSILASSFAYAVDDARNFDQVLSNLIINGDRLVEKYQPSKSLTTSDGFSRLYFDQFESSGLEFRLANYEPELTARIELGFTTLIQSSVNSAEADVVRSQWLELKIHLQQIETDKLNTESWAGSFVQSFLILLREGVEAILLILLLVTLLSRSGHGDKLWLIWGGAATALLASVGLAFLLQLMLKNAGQTREVLEGAILLCAAALLCYVSLWLLSQKESKQWQKFLHQHIEQGLKRSNQFAVFFMAFIAVFREGAETILFYQALLIESQSSHNALWLGASLALALLLLFYFGLDMIIRRIRLDYFFKFTAISLFLMALIFTGKGVMELQASGFLSVTSIKGMIMLPLLGVFPTLEGVLSQLSVVVLFAAVIFILTIKEKERTTVN